MLLQAYSAQAQLLLEENFSYSTGQLMSVSGGSWINFSGLGSNPILVSSGSLVYTGYPSSGIGNKIDIISTTATAEDDGRVFSQSQMVGSTVYFAFLLNVADTIGLSANSSTTGDYFATIVPSGSISYFGRVSIRKGAATNTYNLGLRASTTNATAVWSAVDLAPGTTHLVLVRYQMISGSANDDAALFIDPSLSGAEPTPDISQISTSTAEPDSIGRIAIRQGSAGTPNASIDGIRAGTTWDNIRGVLPVNPLVVYVSPANNAANISPNSAISVTFDRLMNAATIDTASFAVSGIKQSRYYPDSIRPSSNNAIYTFYVQDSLRKSDTITVTLSTAIADTDGNHLLAPYSWKFYIFVPETIKPYLVASNPANGTEWVRVNTSIALTFSEALVPATIDTGSFEILGVKRSRYPISAPVLSNGNTLATITLADSLYYSDTITVHIKPVISDPSGNLVRDTSITFKTKLRPGLSIRDIQYTISPSGDSPYKDSIVTIEGIVTSQLLTKMSTDKSFCIQDEYGPWNGIWVYDPGVSFSVGNRIRLTGQVQEYYERTTIGNIQSFEMLDSYVPLPAPDSTNTTGAVDVEAYEGVLVRVRNVGVTAAPNTYGEWTASDGSGNCWFDDASGYSYDAKVGDSLKSITGVMDYTFSSFKIQPRSDDDIIDNFPPYIKKVLVTDAAVLIFTNKPLNTVFVNDSTVILQGNKNGYRTFTITEDTLLCELKLWPQPAFAIGESLTLTLKGTIQDISGITLDGNANRISEGSPSDDYMGKYLNSSLLLSIANVQKPGANGFASCVEGNTVTIEGMVSGPDKYFSSSTATNASWYVQDNTGGLNVYGGTKDVFLLGRRVVVTGIVTEYNGITELSSSAADISVLVYARELIEPKTMVYNQLLGESIEGLLVSVEGTVSAIPAYAGGGYNMEIRNGNATIAVRISETSGFNLNPFVYGAKVRVTGIVSQYDKEYPYNSGYQLVPRFGTAYTYDGVNYPPDMVVLTDTIAAAVEGSIVSVSPNPFSPDYGQAGIIELNAPSGDHLTLRIYDLKGRLVKNCLNNVPGGHQYYYWDGTDDSHRRVCIGMYIAHLRTVTAEGSITDKTKVIVLATKLQ
ncbi:Ig-like domain-containing protein [candidate division TA06 bacterium]|nr:Ig-like domain-containing protein [candidate division TA06 bacterium]